MSETSLDEVAAAADRVADDQRQVGRQARAMRRQRDQGRSWRDILDRQSAPGILERLRRSARLLGSVTTGLSRTVARGLSREGESRRQITRRVGVTHQRVTALVNHERPD